MNPEKAIDLFKQACAGDFGSACSNLGAIYLSGQGAKVDYKQAKHFFKKACDLQEEAGCQGYKTLTRDGY